MEKISVKKVRLSSVIKIFTLLSFLPLYSFAIEPTLSDNKIYSNNDSIDIRQFGAICDGKSDDTIALQKSIDTGKNIALPIGECVIKNGILLSKEGQIIRGQGRKRTILIIPKDFDKSAKGIFISPTYGSSNSNQAGPQFRDFKITFSQPDTAIRNQLLQYPPAFYLRNSPRFQIDNIQVTQATNIIDMRGDSGGAFISNLEGSSWGTGILIDGSTDTVRISKYHFWPFDITKNQYKVWEDNKQSALISGRMDDLRLTDSFTYRASWNFIKTPLGSTWGIITNNDLDTGGSLHISAGSLIASNLIISTADTTSEMIVNNGGKFICNGCYIYINNFLVNPAIQSVGENTATAINSSFLHSTNDNIIVHAENINKSFGNNQISFVGNQIFLPKNHMFKKPLIYLGMGSQGIVASNQISDIGNSTGIFAKVMTNNALVNNNLIHNLEIQQMNSSTK